MFFLKRLGIIIVLYVATVGVVFTVGSGMLESAFSSNLVQAARVSGGYGLHLYLSQLERFRITSLQSIELDNLRVGFRLAGDSRFEKSNSFVLRVNSLVLSSPDLKYQQLTLIGNGLDISYEALPNLDIAMFGTRNLSQNIASIRAKTFSTTFSINPSNPRQGVKDHLTRLSELPLNGYTSAPFILDASFALNIEGLPSKIALDIVQTEEGKTLVLNKDDLKTISEHLRPPLSEQEIQMLSNAPLRAPLVLNIRKQIERQLQEVEKERQDFPSDAYRAVLCGYLYTQAFSPEYMREISRAYFESLGRNAADERNMDLSNLAIGEKLAAKGIPDDRDLVAFVTNEPSVILKPSRMTWSTR